MLAFRRCTPPGPTTCRPASWNNCRPHALIGGDGEHVAHTDHRPGVIFWSAVSCSRPTSLVAGMRAACSNRAVQAPFHSWAPQLLEVVAAGPWNTIATLRQGAAGNPLSDLLLADARQRPMSKISGRCARR